MNTWQIIVGILMILVSVVIIAVVLLQQGRRTGIGAISGGADTFFSKNKGKTKERYLSVITTVLSIICVLVAVVLVIVVAINEPAASSSSAASLFMGK